MIAIHKQAGSLLYRVLYRGIGKQSKGDTILWKVKFDIDTCNRDFLKTFTCCVMDHE